MKKSTVISMLALGCSLFAFADASFATGVKDETPKDKSVTELHRHFPSAADVTWYSGENSFTAYYTLRDEKAISHFTKDGKLVFTILYRSPNELPVTIYESINSKYKGYKIINVEQYLGANSNFYSVLLESKTKLIRLKAVNESDIHVVQDLNKE